MNNNYQSWQAWVQQVMKHMEKQQQMINQLTQKIEQLQMNEHPKTVIEKIEYHFDQLKIDTLEGTLQIGLTPNGSDAADIGDFYANQGQMPPQQDPVLHQLQKYMNTDIPQWMNQYTRDHDIPVTDHHKEQIIADVRKQLSQRIEHYKNQNPDLDDAGLVNQVQNEIRHSIAQYFDSFQGDGTS
ncbi:spore germination protein GerPC [Halobacillus sp. K22]|uniref:spore germination protein GerPC n=1 Tax=Halobacillus sp. K22 TaxID=3457431 RepID=UPI003FCE9EAE